MPFEFTCERCGGRFTRTKRRSPFHPNRYCSRACQYSRPATIKAVLGPDGSILVPLNNGLFAIIDEIDAELVLPYNWCFTNGYAVRGRRASDGDGSNTILMHRVILGVPDGVEVDHIDRRKLNNRRSNLRPASPSQNRANTALMSNNTSGYRGVRRVRNRWQARIGRNHLGCFATAEEAALAFDAKAVELYGDYAWLNFPDDS